MNKKIRMFVSMLAAAAMLVLLPDGNVMTAAAEEANTYSVKYIGGDINDWRFLPGSTFDDSAYHREIYYLMTENLKDGDHVVVYGGDVTPNKELDLGSFKLGSLTVYNNAQVVILTGGVKDCYILANASASVNGAVTNAHLYDSTTCNFNGNVVDMTLHDASEPHSNISCAGTVGYFRIEDNTGSSKGDFYDIPKNTMRYVNGTIQFAQWSYTPTDAYLQLKAAAEGTTAAPAPETPASAPEPSAPAPAGDAASNEYDKVPKTGDSNQAVWLIGAAAILFAGSHRLYRKAK